MHPSGKSQMSSNFVKVVHSEAFFLDRVFNIDKSDPLDYISCKYDYHS